MPPEELQRWSVEERAKALLSRTADTKRRNWHMLKVATNATGVLAKMPFEADVIFGVARMLGDPAHREMLRKLGRDDQAVTEKQIVLVEVPAPVDDEVDVTLTKVLGLRRHTSAEDISSVWVYRGDGVISVIENLVGPLGGAVTQTRLKDVGMTPVREAATRPPNPTDAENRSDRATDLLSEEFDARGEAQGLGEAPTFEIASASVLSIASEADLSTTAGKRDHAHVAREPTASICDAYEPARPVLVPWLVPPNYDAKSGALGQAFATRLRQDTVARLSVRNPWPRSVPEQTAVHESRSAARKGTTDASVARDFLKNLERV